MNYVPLPSSFAQLSMFPRSLTNTETRFCIRKPGNTCFPPCWCISFCWFLCRFWMSFLVQTSRYPKTVGFYPQPKNKRHINHSKEQDWICHPHVSSVFLTGRHCLYPIFLWFCQDWKKSRNGSPCKKAGLSLVLCDPLIFGWYQVSVVQNSKSLWFHHLLLWRQNCCFCPSGPRNRIWECSCWFQLYIRILSGSSGNSPPRSFSQSFPSKAINFKYKIRNLCLKLLQMKVINRIYVVFRFICDLRQECVQIII